MNVPPLSVKLKQQKVQAFRTIVPTFEGGPVVIDPALTKLRHLRAGQAADSFDMAAEYTDVLEGEWAYIGPKYHHFGHIMAEMVHRIIPAKRAFQAKQFLLVTGRNDTGSTGYGDLGSAYRQILDYCDIAADDIKIINRDTIVESLLLCEQGASLSGVPSPVYLELLRDFSTGRLNELMGEPVDLDRVYVSRSRIGHGGGLLGECYFETLLEKEGWTIYHPEDHPFVHQLQTYRSAKTLVFAEGSACHGTELLGREMMGDVFILIRRQNALYSYRNVLAPRSQSFSGFRDSYFLGSAVQMRSSGRLLDEYGMSLLDIARLGAFFRANSLAELQELDVGSYLEAAREDLQSYIEFHPPAGTGSDISQADGWTVSEFRMRFERQGEALLQRNRRNGDCTSIAVPNLQMQETADASEIEQAAWDAHRAHDWPAAEQAWQRYRIRFMEDMNGYLNGATALIMLDRAAEAVSMLTGALKSFPGQLDILVGRSIACAYAGDTEKAQQYWTDITARAVTLLDSARTIARRILADLADHQNAQAPAAIGLADFADDPNVLAGLGWAAHLRKDWDSALRHWTMYMQMFPDHMLGYSLMTTTLLCLRDTKAAEEIAAAGLRRLPDDPELLEKHAYVAQTNEQWHEALRRWDKVVAAKPENQALKAARDAIFRRTQQQLPAPQDDGRTD